jgi:hypothetical protein
MSREQLDKMANEFINARRNKDSRTDGDSTVWGLTFNALHSHLIQFALAAMAEKGPKQP